MLARENYISENLNEFIVDSIIENKDKKEYLLNRYVRAKNHIKWLVDTMDLSILKNRQFVYTMNEEIKLINDAILN